MRYELLGFVQSRVEVGIKTNQGRGGVGVHIGFVIAFPSARVLHWINVHKARVLDANQVRYDNSIVRLIEAYWSKSDRAFRIHRSSDVVDRLMDFFYDFPVVAYGNRPSVMELSECTFNSLMDRAVHRYNCSLCL